MKQEKRRFYLSFPIRQTLSAESCETNLFSPIQDTVRPELSWSHYRLQMTVKNNESGIGGIR